MKKTVAYYRCSMERQLNSISIQRNKTIQYCVNQFLVIDEEFVDENVSARKNKMAERREFSRMLEEIQAGKIENLLVYKRDRMARNFREHMEVYRLLAKHKVNVHFTAGEQDMPMIYSPFGEYMELMLGGFSQYEGAQINERTTEAKLRRFEKRIADTTLPFGYRAHPDTRVIMKEEAELEIVHYIFKQILTGEHGKIGDLVKHVNARGMKRRGKNWEWSEVDRLIQNPLYGGTRMMKLRGQIYCQEFLDLSVVTKEEWQKANDFLKSMKSKKSGPAIPRVELLEGLSFCQQCNKGIRIKERMRNGNKLWFYECPDGHASIVKEELERAVWEYGCEFFNNLLDEHIEELTARFLKKDIKELKTAMQLKIHEINTLTTRLEKQTDEWIKQRKGTTYRQKTETEIWNTRKKLEGKRRDLDHLKTRLYEMENYKDCLQNIDLNLRENPNLSLEDKKKLLQDMIYRVEVDANQYHMVIKHPFIVKTGVYLDESTT